MSDFLTISNANELIRIPAESLVYIASEGNYSDIHTRNGQRRTVTMQLGVIEELIDKQLKESKRTFVRIGRSLIVNLHFVHYVQPARQQLILSDGHTFQITTEASKEALKKLRDFFDNELKRQ